MTLNRSPCDAPALSIVVPTYNERERLDELVATIDEVWRRHGLSGEIIIVDDNSPDGTGQRADELACRYPVHVIHRRGKLGLGTAVIEGFAAARSPVMGVLDADLSHPPELLPTLLLVLRETNSDIVVASRYVQGGGTRNWPVVRLLLSRLACRLARPLTPVRDATSGFFLIRRELIRNVTISAAGFKICLELLVRGRPRAVAEVPYQFIGRTAGESKMNPGEAAGYLKQLAKLLLFRLSDRAAAEPVYWQVAASPISPVRPL